MTLADARLQRMIAQLATMPQDDQAFVLERLGHELRDRVMPMLTTGAPSEAISPGLEALVQSAARGQPQTLIAPKAIAALRSLKLPMMISSSVGRAPDGLAGRVAALIRGGAR